MERPWCKRREGGPTTTLKETTRVGPAIENTGSAFYNDILYKSATQCSTIRKVARKLESKKLQRLRKKSLQLARKIKKEYRSGRMDRFTSAEREYEKVIEKQKKAEREIEKRKKNLLLKSMTLGKSIVA